MRTFYQTGNVSVQNSSDQVSGVGTYWASATLKPIAGDLITFDFVTLYGVKEVINDGSLVLDRPYTGTDLTNMPYTVIRTASQSTNTRLSGEISDVLQKLGDRVTVSTTAPSAGQGNDGDIWIVVA